MTDSVMAAAFADISVGLPHPNYIRLDRKVCEPIYTNGHKFECGYARINRGGKGVALVATGNMVHYAFDIAKELGGLDVYDVYALPINGLDADLAECEKIITLEEHALAGGFGSAVLEVLSDAGLQIPVKRIGLDFSQGFCYQYGGREELQKACGIDKESIKMEVKQWLH